MMTGLFQKTTRTNPIFNKPPTTSVATTELEVLQHTGAKTRNLSKNSHFQRLIYHKIHILKISFLTKFTISKSHFSQNSHFQSLILDKIHIFKASFFTKFTF